MKGAEVKVEEKKRRENWKVELGEAVPPFFALALSP
jgi:hypothetical protein